MWTRKIELGFRTVEKDKLSYKFQLYTNLEILCELGVYKGE